MEIQNKFCVHKLIVFAKDLTVTSSTPLLFIYNNNLMGSLRAGVPWKLGSEQLPILPPPELPRQVKDSNRNFSEPTLTIVGLNVQSRTKNMQDILSELSRTNNWDILCIEDAHKDETLVQTKNKDL